MVRWGRLFVCDQEKEALMEEDRAVAAELERLEWLSRLGRTLDLQFFRMRSLLLHQRACRLKKVHRPPFHPARHRRLLESNPRDHRET